MRGQLLGVGGQTAEARLLGKSMASPAMLLKAVPPLNTTREGGAGGVPASWLPWTPLRASTGLPGRLRLLDSRHTAHGFLVSSMQVAADQANVSTSFVSWASHLE